MTATPQQLSGASSCDLRELLVDQVASRIRMTQDLPPQNASDLVMAKYISPIKDNFGRLVFGQTERTGTDQASDGRRFTFAVLHQRRQIVVVTKELARDTDQQKQEDSMRDAAWLTLKSM